MWIYMQQLRENGEPLSAQALAERPPLIGTLRLGPGHERWGQGTKEAVLVEPVKRTWSALIYRADVIAIRPNGLYLTGIEETFGRRAKDVRVHPQEWRCWPVDCPDMRMNVVPLRERGQRLAADVLKNRAQAPLTGSLALSVGHPRRGSQLEANLSDPETCTWLGVLYRASVKTIEARGMIIVGIERVFERRARENEVFRQAWWCWPALNGVDKVERPVTSWVTGTERVS